MFKTLQTVNMVATIVNATINLSKALVALTTRHHKYDIDLGINLDYKSDLSMLFDIICKHVKKAYTTIKNFILNHIILVGYSTEIALTLIFAFYGFNIIYLESLGVAFLLYRIFVYVKATYFNHRQLQLAY